MRFLNQLLSPGRAAALQHQDECIRIRKAMATAVSEEERQALRGELELKEATRKAHTSANLAKQYVEKKPGHNETKLAVASAEKAKGTLASVKARVRQMLGLDAPAPVASASAAPPDTSSPAALSRELAALFTFDKSRARDADYLVETIGRVETMSAFIDAVSKIDPSGKILEQLDSGSDSERARTAAVLGPILAKAKASATPATAPSPTPPKTVAAAPKPPVVASTSPTQSDSNLGLRCQTQILLRDMGIELDQKSIRVTAGGFEAFTRTHHHWKRRLSMAKNRTARDTVESDIEAVLRGDRGNAADILRSANLVR